MRLTWVQPEDLLLHAFVQAQAEGTDVSDLTARWLEVAGTLDAPVSGAAVTPASDADRDLARRLLEEVEARTVRHADDAAAVFARSAAPVDLPTQAAPDRILGAKGAGLVLGLLLGMLIIGPSASGVVLSLGLAVMLFFAPDLALYNAALRRKDLASKSLAEALDMLTISVEAGQAFDAAIGHVARTITGPVAGEFARVLSEIQLGRSRSDARRASSRSRTRRACRRRKRGPSCRCRRCPRDRP